MFFINRCRNTCNDSSPFANSYIGSVNNGINTNNSNKSDINKQNTEFKTDKTIYYDDMWKYDIPDDAKHFSINLAKSWSLCNNKSHDNQVNRSTLIKEKKKNCEECEELQEEHESCNGQTNIAKERSKQNNYCKSKEEECCYRSSNSNVKSRSLTLPLQHNIKNNVTINEKKNVSINKTNIIYELSETSKNVLHDECNSNSESTSCNSVGNVFVGRNNDDLHRNNNLKMEKKCCNNEARDNYVEELEQEEELEQRECSTELTVSLPSATLPNSTSLIQPAMLPLEESSEDNNYYKNVNSKDKSVKLDEAKCYRCYEPSNYESNKSEKCSGNEYSHHNGIFDENAPIGKGRWSTQVNNEELVCIESTSLPWTSSARSFTTNSSQQSLLELSKTLTPKAHVPNEEETIEEHPNSSFEFVSVQSSLVGEPSLEPTPQSSSFPSKMPKLISLLEESSSEWCKKNNSYGQELQHTSGKKMKEYLDLDEEVCPLQFEQDTNKMQLQSCRNTTEKENSLSWSCTVYNDDPLHSNDDYGLAESTKNSLLATNENSLFSLPLDSNVMKDVDILNQGDTKIITGKRSSNINYHHSTYAQRTWDKERGKHTVRELDISLLRFIDNELKHN